MGAEAELFCGFAVGKVIIHEETFFRRCVEAAGDMLICFRCRFQVAGIARVAQTAGLEMPVKRMSRLKMLYPFASVDGQESNAIARGPQFLDDVEGALDSHKFFTNHVRKPGRSRREFESGDNGAPELFLGDRSAHIEPYVDRIV